MDPKTLADLFEVARTKALKAGHDAKPTPMIVGHPTTPFGSDIDYSRPVDYVSEGLCGFAWVHFPDARKPEAKYALSLPGGHKGYPTGVDLFCHEYGQSVDRKEAWAQAFADVLKAYGVKCYAMSRLD